MGLNLENLSRHHTSFGNSVCCWAGIGRQETRVYDGRVRIWLTQVLCKGPQAFFFLINASPRTICGTNHNLFQTKLGRPACHCLDTWQPHRKGQTSWKEFAGTYCHLEDQNSCLKHTQGLIALVKTILNLKGGSRLHSSHRKMPVINVCAYLQAYAS